MHRLLSCLQLARARVHACTSESAAVAYFLPFLAVTVASLHEFWKPSSTERTSTLAPTSTSTEPNVFVCSSIS